MNDKEIRFSTEDIQVEQFSPEWERNQRMRRKNLDYVGECFLCGRPVANPKHQVLVDWSDRSLISVEVGEAIPDKDIEKIVTLPDGSAFHHQGWTDVGNTCARKIPKAFKG